MTTSSKNKPNKVGFSKVLKENLLYRGHWSELVQISYEDEEKKI